MSSWIDINIRWDSKEDDFHEEIAPLFGESKDYPIKEDLDEFIKEQIGFDSNDLELELDSIQELVTCNLEDWLDDKRWYLNMLLDNWTTAENTEEKFTRALFPEKLNLRTNWMYQDDEFYDKYFEYLYETCDDEILKRYIGFKIKKSKYDEVFHNTAEYCDTEDYNNDRQNKIDAFLHCKSFVGLGLNKPGTLIQVHILDRDVIETVLIGDVNGVGGMYNIDEMGNFIQPEDIVLKYKVVWSPDEEG